VALAGALTVALVGEPAAHGQPATGKPAATGKPVDEATAARNLYREAKEHSAAGRLSLALDKYREAFAVLPTPTLLWPIAELSLQLGQPVEGLDALQKYRQMMAPAEMEPGQQLADADRLEKRLRERIATVRTSGGTGALIVLDGRELGRAPLPEPILVNPGSHRVEYTSARGTQAVNLELAPGADQTVDLGDAPPAPGDSGAPGVRYKMHPLPAVLLGLSAGTLGAASVFGGLALGKTLDLSGNPACQNGLCIGMQGTDIGGLADTVSAQRTYSAASIVLLGTGSVLLASSLILIGVDVHRQRRGQKLFSLTLTPHPPVAASGAAVSLGLLPGGQP
jgi:hypothetical protein